MDDSQLCPCKRGELFGACCGPLLAGERPAGSAEVLMRSRYTAFAVGDTEYLLRSWHPRTRPKTLDLDPNQRWLFLEIVRTVLPIWRERCSCFPFRSPGGPISFRSRC